jgi:SAM-dependent MidA family methyltransferase
VNLRQKIEQEIRACGPIPFSRYMELCLYDPELGYYSRDAEKFGKAGDFYTSSDVHAVFGRLLARQFEEMWRALGSPAEIELLELGPGRGLFAQDVLDWAEKKFPQFYQALHYTLDERSPSLRGQLEARFRERVEGGNVRLLPQVSTAGLGRRLESPAGGDARRSIRKPGTRAQREGHGFSRAEQLSNVRRALAPEVPLIVFANEFFDALPVEVLSEKGSLRISSRGGRFVEEWAQASPDELEFLDRYGVHPSDRERTEVGLLSQRTMAGLGAAFERGFLVVIDYGYTREEQLAGRHLDTIMTYRQHSASPDAYQAPGEQDITAHVNFTALAAAAERAGMQVHKLLTQSQFLLGIGEANQFADAFEDCRLPQERAKVALQLKHLVTPSGMGETFHVLVGSKGVERESLTRLSGLSFGNGQTRV